ncbi:MAG: DUF3574 domain-containing protein [Ignavibacteriaceae bacterium]|nr:DUF3574 domain-containing protein [Ignavibacteriaceae bacterium]
MEVINRYLLVLIITIGTIQFQGCLFVKADPGDIALYSQSLNETQTELFFGLSKPDGTMVTDEEWNKFVDDYISPKFMDGFTVVDAHGQWMDNDNKVMKENSKLVIIIYKRNEDMESSINYVIDNYKRLFQQNSVLKVNIPVSVEE